MNIQNLVFFKTDGSQIPIQFTNNITFTLIGNMSERFGRGYGWRSDAKGYISLDEKWNVVGVTLTDKGSTYGFEDKTDYTEAVYGLVDEIQVVVNVDGYKETVSFLKNNDLFDIFEVTIGKREIAVKTETENGDNLIYEYCIEKVDIKDEWKSKLFTKTVTEDEEEIEIESEEPKFHIPEGTSLYPCQQFMGQLFMEKVSTDLVSSETIFVLEKRKNSKGEEGFFRPRSETQNLRFQFPEMSDTRIVKTANEYYSQDRVLSETKENEYDFSKVYWSQYANFNLISEYEDTEDSTEPVFFTMGFSSEYEGCFQDTLNIRTIDGIKGDADLEVHTIGYLMVKNETVGEDERFRTLFTNFGIPDPADYQQVFKDSEILQEDNDWDFINNKSKELFLSYKDIFPYVGTYKALLNAVKFLGYDDIYFKEWYKFFDGSNENKVAYQSVDINTKTPLQSKLERLGVSLEDFINWKKLSQLSLIYLINQQDEDSEVLESYEIENGKKTNIVRKTFAIPSTKPVYTYLNSQILVKLYALKEWLETFILNINCQIIDVAGEGIYFERYKQQAHVAPLYTNFTAIKETNITPSFGSTKGNMVSSLEFGKTTVPCTMKELEENLSLEDYDGKSYMDFLKKVETTETDKISGGDSSKGKKEDVEVGGNDDLFSNKGFINQQINWLKNSEYLSDEDVVASAQTTLRGTSFTNNTAFEGVQYELSADVESGSFQQGVGYYDDEGNFVSKPLVVKDNEVFIYGYREKEVIFKNLPVIRIASGKLRKPFGKWVRNSMFNVSGYFDTERSKSRFCIQSTKHNSQYVSDDYITLYPKTDPSANPSFKYTEKNKYGAPLFVIEDYDTYNGYIASDTSLNKFVVEMNEGYIDMNEPAEGEDGNTCIARMVFEQDYDRNNANEQKIYMKYIYKTPRASLESVDKDNTFDVSVYINDYLDKVQDIYTKTTDVSSLTFETANYDASSNNPLLSDRRLYVIKSNLEKNTSVVEKSISNIQERIDRINELIEECEGVEFINGIDENSDYIGDWYEGLEVKEGQVVRQSDKYLKCVNVSGSSESPGYRFVDIEGNYYTYSDGGFILTGDLNEDFNLNMISFEKVANLFYRLYKNDLDDRTVELEREKTYKQFLYDNAVVEFNELQEYWKERLSIQRVNTVKDLTVDIADGRIRDINQKYHERLVLNHIGKYELTVVATDGCNIPYVQKSDKKLNVTMTPPVVFVNTYTEEDSLYETNVESFDSRPWFIPEYFRVVKRVDRNESSLTYMDYSYFMDTPKKNDFVHLSNTTEKVDEIDIEFDASTCEIPGFVFDKSKGYIKIVMNDENPGNQNIFFLGGELYLTYIDRNSCELANLKDDVESNISKITGPYKIEAFCNPNFRFGENGVLIEEDDEQEENNNYIVLSYNPTDLDFVSVSDTMNELIKSKDVFCFANMQTRIEIEETNIKNNKNDRTCEIRIKDINNYGNLPFSKGQCIKIYYSALTYLGKSGDDEDLIKETYISGTAYKIIDCYFDANTFEQVFILDGLVNTDLIEMKKYKNGVYNKFSSEPSKNMLGVPFKIRCVISPAHWMYVNYDVMATQDGDEDNDEGYFKFDDDWYGTDYLDNTFAFTKRNFKVIDAFDDWKTDFVQEDILYAHNKPVTEFRDSYDKPVSVMVESFDLDNAFEDGEYTCVWDVYYNAGKEKEDEYLLYQLTNDRLVLSLKNDGEYRFQLTAIDKYGNAVTNKKQGFLKIVTR